MNTLYIILVAFYFSFIYCNDTYSLNNKTSHEEPQDIYDWKGIFKSLMGAACNSQIEDEKAETDLTGAQSDDDLSDRIKEWWDGFKNDTYSFGKKVATSVVETSYTSALEYIENTYTKVKERLEHIV